MSFSDNLTWLRRRSGLAQKDFALLIGLEKQQTNISRWEAGKNQPSPEALSLFQEVASKADFDITDFNGVQPGWFSPNLLLLPHQDYLHAIGVDASAPSPFPTARRNRHYRVDAAGQTSIEQVFDKGAGQTRAPSPSAHSPYAPISSYTASLAVSRIVSPEFLNGFYIAVHLASAESNTGAFEALSIAVTDGKVSLSLNHLGAKPEHDQIWNGVIFQSPYSVIMVLESATEPRVTATWTLCPVGESTPYQRFVGTGTTVQGTLPHAVKTTYIGMFREDEVASVNELTDKYRDLTTPRANHRREALKRMILDHRFIFPVTM